MKFPEKWLRELVDPPVPTTTLLDQLTMGGLEVDSVSPVHAEFSNVVVAEIREVQPHPDAEDLKICRVEDGTDAPRAVVCGAPNARVGLRVAFARIGAQLPPDSRVIGEASVRGVLSNGMLCSAAELGLADSADRLMELPKDAAIGLDLASYLDLDDTCVELDLTPNRGDCLSILGVAREVAALNRCELIEPEIVSVDAVSEDKVDVQVRAPESCPVYAGRVIRDVDPSAAIPIWMHERLRRSGLRPISAVVDVTNYVMLEVGQPMHAFDMQKLRGGIQVRYAVEGETIILLDGQQLSPSPGTLMIADEGRAVALAGIMGGIETAVDADTRDIFLESAFFTPAVMAGKARRYRLQTDSSQRFERGVDFSLQVPAVQRATQLLVDICGGKPGPVIDCRYEEHLPARKPIALRGARVRRVLGIDIRGDEVNENLTRLGMQVTDGDGTWHVVPPSFRFDVALEADLIEEIARLTGYHRIPSHRLRGTSRIHPQPEARIGLARLRDALICRGYQEAISYSFVDPKLQARLQLDRHAIPLANPLSRDMSVMRTSLLPGLIQALTHNRYRQHERVRLFEAGLVFSSVETGIEQRAVIGGIIAGSVYPEQWALPNRELDFYDLKRDVEVLLRLSGALNSVEFKPVQHPALHPGQAAKVERSGVTWGFLGTLHPGLAVDLGLEGRVGVFELDLASVTEGVIPSFAPLSRFPMVRRDLSIVVNQEITASLVFHCIAEHAPAELKDFQLFDLYQGKGIDPGEKSLALGLIFQGTSSTLIDKDVDVLVKGILSRLAQKLGARLRD